MNWALIGAAVGTTVLSLIALMVVWGRATGYKPLLKTGLWLQYQALRLYRHVGTFRRLWRDWRKGKLTPTPNESNPDQQE